MHSMCILRILVELTEVQRYEHQLGWGRRGRCGGEEVERGGRTEGHHHLVVHHMVDNTYIPIHFSLG